jgi:hypothetical protein
LLFALPGVTILDESELTPFGNQLRTKIEQTSSDD